jgi:hypothetical protein
MSHCDDDWEHDHGVTIETVDNPGWIVRIDLEGTELATRPFAPVHWAGGSGDWYDMHVSDTAFIVACSPFESLLVPDRVPLLGAEAGGEETSASDAIRSCR